MLNAATWSAEAIQPPTLCDEQGGASSRLRLYLIEPGTFSITALEQDIVLAEPVVVPSTQWRPECRTATGARVLVEFFLSAELPIRTEIHLMYDFASNGSWRECVGIPELSHVTHKATTTFHYRMSHWIRADDIGRLVEK